MILNCSYLSKQIISENTKKDPHNIRKLFHPVFEKQEMSNWGRYVELWEIFLKP